MCVFYGTFLYVRITWFTLTVALYLFKLLQINTKLQYFFIVTKKSTTFGLDDFVCEPYTLFPSFVFRATGTMRIFRRPADQCPFCWKCQFSLSINLLLPNKTKQRPLLDIGTCTIALMNNPFTHNKEKLLTLPFSTKNKPLWVYVHTRSFVEQRFPGPLVWFNI